jgi:predicted PurR-regulated permease PerM
MVLVIHLLCGFISAVVLATVIVSIFDSAYANLLKALGNRTYLAASICTFLVCLGILLPLAGFIIALIAQGLMLFQGSENKTNPAEISSWMMSLKRYLDELNNYLGNFGVSISPERIIKLTATFSQALGEWVYKIIGFLAGNLFALCVTFILTNALVFVFFIRGRLVKQFIMDLIPLPQVEKQLLVDRFRALAYAVFIGNGLISLLEGFIGGLSFLAFQISGALIWGVAIAITSFLPIIGSFIVVVPATVYLFLIGHTWQAIAFLSFNTIQLAILETVVKPKLIGTKAQMHTVLVFMAAFAGVQIYGPLGLFYGPLLITIFLAFAEIYREHYREQLLK